MSKKVLIINDPDKGTCRCGNWMKHWERFSGEKSLTCSEITCHKLAEKGTKVVKTNSQDTRIHIIPLCNHHHSLEGKELYIGETIRLVSANPLETCERK
jgi:hypothetical protein